jgi:UDP-perosamine 4-acetyltransferase
MSPDAKQAGTAILLGAGGHAKVVLTLARALGWHVIGVCDPAWAGEREADWRGVPVLGDDGALASVDARVVGLINGVGQTTGDGARRRLYETWSARGFTFPVLVHPSAVVDPTATLQAGCQVMAGAVVQADSHIGVNTIINTRASVDHDGLLGAHVHVAPGATLCGGVQVHDGAFIGAGATVAPGRSVGRGAFVAAGALVARDLGEGSRWPTRAERPLTRPQENRK